jgi:hypothetical protein
MENENKGNGLQLPVGEAPEPEISNAVPTKRRARARKDKAGLHATKHGILARPLLEALARRGENIRQLRVIERMLREKLQRDGILAELLFDRAWSSFLRCVLIARTEARVLTSQGPPSDLSFIPNLPKLPKSDFSFDDISVLRLQQIALIQRYDAHFSRDFHRTVGLLMGMRHGGNAGLTKQLEKSYGKDKEDLSEE